MQERDVRLSSTLKKGKPSMSCLGCAHTRFRIVYLLGAKNETAHNLIEAITAVAHHFGHQSDRIQDEMRINTFRNPQYVSWNRAASLSTRKLRIHPSRTRWRSDTTKRYSGGFEQLCTSQDYHFRSTGLFAHWILCQNIIQQGKRRSRIPTVSME